jgi:hypothetical protein
MVLLLMPRARWCVTRILFDPGIPYSLQCIGLRPELGVVDLVPSSTSIVIKKNDHL